MYDLREVKHFAALKKEGVPYLEEIQCTQWCT